MAKDGKETKKSVLFPEPTVVTVGVGEAARTYEIGPLPRKKYKKLFKLIADTIQGLIDDEEAKQGIDLNKLDENVGLFIEILGDKVLEIYAIVTGEDLEWLEDNLLMNQEIELISAIIDQNDIEGIVKNFRKMVAKVKPPSTKANS